MTNNNNLPGTVRRSWLMASASQVDKAVAAPQSNVDVVLLDLVEFVAEKDKPAAREGLTEIVRQVRESSVDVFAQVDSELLYADLHACVCPELTGVVISHLESVAQVEEADALIGQLEDQRGIPPGTLPTLLTDEDMLQAATNSKNLGFKGIVCPHPSWIASVNTAFTPTEDQVDFYKQVRDVFAQAIAAGTAAVPVAGRMIDVLVDEWAKVVIATSTACRQRDAEKQSSLETASA